MMELLFSPPTYSFKDDDNNKDVVVVVTHPLSEFSQGGQKTAPILIRVLDSAPVGDFVDTPDESQSWA